MCRRAVCQSCRKATYEGCGMHVEQVLADVPRHERCLCGTTGRERVRPVGRSNDRWWERLVTWMKSPA